MTATPTQPIRAARRPLEEVPERVVGRVKDVEPAHVQILAGTAADAQGILLDVHEGGEDRVGSWFKRNVLRQTRQEAELTSITTPSALGPNELVYPQVFRRDDLLEMTAAELVDELDTIAGSGWPSSFESPYIYAVQVTEPRSYTFGGHVEEFGDLLYDHATRSEISVGMLGHESLYRPCDSRTRRALLEALLCNADKVKVSVQPPAAPYHHIYVKLLKPTHKIG